MIITRKIILKPFLNYNEFSNSQPEPISLKSAVIVSRTGLTLNNESSYPDKSNIEKTMSKYKFNLKLLYANLKIFQIKN